MPAIIEGLSSVRERDWWLIGSVGRLLIIHEAETLLLDPGGGVVMKGLGQAAPRHLSKCPQYLQ